MKKNVSPETREKLRQAQLGRKRSPEARESMRQARLRRWQDPEYRRRMIAARRRRPPYSLETRQKMARAQAGRRYQGRVARWGHDWLAVKGGRWYVRLFGTWMPQAWVVWVQHHGPIPRGADGKPYHVHHRNDDTLDDDPSNLQALTHTEHLRLHSRRRTPPSEATREKLRQAARRRWARAEEREDAAGVV